MTTVLICGSRTLMDGGPMYALMAMLPEDTTIVHGAAKGADTLARVNGAKFHFTIREFPARWDLHGKAAGPIRNQQMLDEGSPDVVWAFTDKPLEQSRGTADMVQRARKAGLPVLLVQWEGP